jgi:hypothetical protein
MIATISPSIYDIAMTRETLEYAVSAGTIKNKPTNISMKDAAEIEIKILE